MLKHEYLFTPGELQAHNESVVTEFGVIIANCTGRYLKNLDDRIYETKCNAALFAEAKNMLKIIEVIAALEPEADSCFKFHALINTSRAIIAHLKGPKR